MSNNWQKKWMVPNEGREYIEHGAWYYLRAQGDEEQFESTIHRMLASEARQRLERLSIEVPPAAELYRRAQEMWPQDRLHAL